MANNRIWLVNTRTGEKICLAKYYPSTGWYTFATSLDDWFDRDTIPPTQYGHTDFAMFFDISDDPTKELPEKYKTR